MATFIKFRITACRFGIAGISEVSGRVGIWPFSRPVSYHAGINCDAIDAGDDGVRVYRRGALLMPRHTRRAAPMVRGPWK